MVLTVTQQAFDDAVKENMEEFDMPIEDAIKETVEQFKTQGADLSKIITDMILSDSNSNSVISEAIQALNHLNKEAATTEPQKYITHLETIRNECGKGLKFQILCARQGAYGTILDVILTCGSNNKEIVMNSLSTLVVLMTKQPDLLDDKGIQIIIKYLSNEKDLSIIRLILQWTRQCCILHEMNRQHIFEAGALSHLKLLLNESHASEILKDVLGVLRALVLDDDVRVEFGRAHEHARAIAAETLSSITTLLHVFKKDEFIVNDIMLTLSALLVRTEFCKNFEDAGGLKIIREIMTDFLNSDKIIRQCMKLLKVLAGNDECKAHVIQNGMAPDIVFALDRHKGNANSAVIGLGCVAALTLRNPENSKAFFEAGVTEIIVEIMMLHVESESVQKNASWAIRNMVSRSRYQNKKFLDLGVEDILKANFKKFKKYEYDMKAALRDLGCDVQLKEEWTGKGGLLSTQETMK